MDGTVPAGSSWRKFPLPTVLWQREGPSFAPVCNESQACKDYARGGGFGPRTGVCRCSGHSNGGPLLPNLEMVDLLQIPADTPPGKYVLQWRWDCTATSTSFAVHFSVSPYLCISVSPYLRISQRHTTLHLPYDLLSLGARAYRVLIGACNPMLCPIPIFRRGDGPDLAELCRRHRCRLRALSP